MRSLCTATKRSRGVPCSPQLEKAHAKQQRSSKAKKKKPHTHTLRKLGTEGNFLNTIKDSYGGKKNRNRANITCNSKLKTDRLSPKIKNKTRMSAFTTSIQHSCYSVTRLCPTCNWQEKEIKGIYFRKEEIKLALFTNDMILYMKNSTDSTSPQKKNLLEQMNSAKLQNTKSIHKNQLHFYASNEKS